MSKLEPGILALVIGFRDVESNLGKIVTLERFVKAGDVAFSTPVCRDLWVIRGEGVGYTLGGEIVLGNKGLSSPQHLMPIKPEADIIHEEDLSKLEA